MVISGVTQPKKFAMAIHDCVENMFNSHLDVLVAYRYKPTTGPHHDSKGKQVDIFHVKITHVTSADPASPIHRGIHSFDIVEVGEGRWGVCFMDHDLSDREAITTMTTQGNHDNPLQCVAIALIASIQDFIEERCTEAETRILGGERTYSERNPEIPF